MLSLVAMLAPTACAAPSPSTASRSARSHGGIAALRARAKTLRSQLAEAQRQVDVERRARRREARRADRAETRAKRLERQLEHKTREVQRLREKLEEALRARKRQATPFSKGDPKPDPEKPGRKPGRDYGQRGARARPKNVDEVLEAQLPAVCPHCGGAIAETAVEQQFVTDIPPVRPHTTQFNVHVGCCKKCGKRVQGRHPRQHSDALGAASVQIGPLAIALAAHLNKLAGASYDKIAKFFLSAWGIGVAPSTLVRALGRLAARGGPVYAEIADAVRESSIVYPDETGWKVDGLKSWLWAFVGEDGTATLYTIRFSRGFDVVESTLGKDWDGVLGHDGWAPYDRLRKARHQQCLQHLIRRAKRILESATGGAVRFPRTIKAILGEALSLRDRHENGEISDHGLLTAVGRLAKRLDDALAGNHTYEPNRVFADHLRKHRDEVFTFLYLRVSHGLKVEATNWPAEHAIRPAVINRKTSGGNRSPQGAETQAVLSSIFRTCQQRGIDPIALLVDLLRAEDPADYADHALGGPGP